MARNRSDAVVVTYQPAGRAARREVFEPTSDGRYERVEEVRREDGTWHRVGSEVVESVIVEDPRDE